MGSVPVLILDSLNELLEEEFKSFKWQLTDGVAKGFCPISKGKLEKARQTDVVDFMVGQYGLSEAGNITVRILRNIQHNNIADELKKRLSDGAHPNPAVSLSFCVLGQLHWKKLLPYSLSQVLGAYLASAVVYIMYYEAIMEYSGGVLTAFGPNETASIFATYPTEGVSLQTNFFDQVVGTATLLMCILPLSDQRNRPAPDALLPPIVATVVLGISMSMSSNCGGAINPARDLGPHLFTLTAGWGTEVFTCFDYFFWVPLVAPMIGGLIGCFLYVVFIQWHLPDPNIDPEFKEPPEIMTATNTKVLEGKEGLHFKMADL
ncbi:aquaporin-10-like [Brachyhypopomus gauderio]|uniref:aquaporin-10-like n=1 Tax=Brachyhypopomus gauderio TaxID=698409 RepID=UPI00404374A1